MKKIIPFLIGFLLGLAQIVDAQTLTNDTTLQYKNKTIHLQDSIGQMKVIVFDNDSTPYKKVYEVFLPTTKATKNGPWWKNLVSSCLF